MKTRAVSWIVLLLVVAACEKAGSKGSGALSSSDLDLFRSLPAGQNAVFGGNYMKLQNFMNDTAAGRAARRVTESLGKGMKEWMDCFTNLKDLRIAGTASVGGSSQFQLRMVMAGADLGAVQDCAKKAGFKNTLDADGKFLALDIPSLAGTQTQGYLKLGNGALYTRQGFALGAMPTIVTASRAELEADIAAVGKNSVADETKMQEILAKADRSKTMWFAGTAANTPVSDRVGEFYGSLDVAPGIAFDVTAQVLKSEDARKIEDGLADMKKMADQLPGELKSVIEGIELHRDGDHLRVVAKVSDSQIASIMQLAGGGLGRTPIRSIDVQPRGN